MTITVTADNIAHGKPCEPRHCAVALALTDQLGGQWFVDTPSAWGSGHRYIDLPPEVDRFIQRFDAGREVEPIAFEVRL
jgi:hypothetical protein